MRRLTHLTLAFVLGSITTAFAHSSDGKPCPQIQDINIEAEFRDTVGFPVLHDGRIDEDSLFEDCKDRFCFGHNAETKTPIWVMEKMSRAISCGDNKRPKGWKAEGTDTSKWAQDKDYKNSGYARGHNAASDDFKSTRDWMKQTFTFANAIPQIQNGFNGSYWRFLEEDVKHLALSGHDLYVITGPIPLADDGKPYVIEPSGGACKSPIKIAGERDLNLTSICGGEGRGKPHKECAAKGVAVPAGMYKIIYLAKYNRVFAYAAANIDHRPVGKTYDHHDAFIETWRVSIEDIELLTNINFFPELEKRQRNVDKTSCIPTPKH